MLCKALDLWQCIGALEKWARESRRGDGPPTGESPHLAAIATDYAPVGRAPVFLLVWRLDASHPPFRLRRAGEELAELAAAETRDAVGLEPSPEFSVPCD